MRFSIPLGLALVTALVALPAEAQPRPGAAAAHTLAAAASPSSVAVQAGGADRNAVPGSGCSGFINNAQPTATVQFDGDGPLAIYATSDTDTTLLVADPSGRWHCSDDANGSNPAVTFARGSAGDYTVWVGTFSPDAAGAAAQVYAVRGQPAW
ncbi:MAG: hypothetical protein AAF845_06625 [Bacteroidota bacterium]